MTTLASCKKSGNSASSEKNSRQRVKWMQSISPDLHFVDPILTQLLRLFAMIEGCLQSYLNYKVNWRELTRFYIWLRKSENLSFNNNPLITTRIPEVNQSTLAPRKFCYFIISFFQVDKKHTIIFFLIKYLCCNKHAN